MDAARSRAGPILRVEGVSKLFGGIQALTGCSIDVAEGSISGLIGPNGSGKTTLFNVITGMLRPDGGDVFLRGERITRLPPWEVVRRGVGRTFQITRLFARMTVKENLRVAARGRRGAESEARAEELLRLTDLWRLGDEYAENLSYGQQKLLEFARAAMPQPAMLLLDEPFAGVNRVMALKLVGVIRRFQAEGVTFLIIDHEMKLLMELCDSIFVLDFGQLIAEGPPERVCRDATVQAAYFGR